MATSYIKPTNNTHVGMLVEGNTMVVNNADYSTIQFGDGSSVPMSANDGGIIYSHAARRYTFRSKGTVNGKNEDYRLPLHSDGAADATYDILTTKDASTFRGASTGTAANDNKFLFTLPRTGAAILMIGSTLCSVLRTSDGTLYPTGMPSGFSMTVSGDIVTINRNVATTYLVHGIMIN